MNEKGTNVKYTCLCGHKISDNYGDRCDICGTTTRHSPGEYKIGGLIYDGRGGFYGIGASTIDENDKSHYANTKHKSEKSIIDMICKKHILSSPYIQVPNRELEIPILKESKINEDKGDDMRKEFKVVTFEELLNMIGQGYSRNYEDDKNNITITEHDELVITGGLIKAGYTGEINEDLIKEVKLNAKDDLIKYDYKRHILLMNDMDTAENILNEVLADDTVKSYSVCKDGNVVQCIEILYISGLNVRYNYIENKREESRK